MLVVEILQLLKGCALTLQGLHLKALTLQLGKKRVHCGIKAIKALVRKFFVLL